MNIVSDRTYTIFKHKYSYSIGLSKKKQDGTYDNAYFPIAFNKGVELENKTKIRITNAWLDFYKTNKDDEEKTTFQIRCNQFEIVENQTTQKETSQEDPYEKFGKQVEISENDLPF